MKYELNIANAEKILANAECTPLESVRASFVVATCGKDTESVKDYAKKHNKKAIAESVSTLWNGDDFKWESFVDGVNYVHIDFNADSDKEAIKLKDIRAWEVFCKKSTKDSHKKEIASSVFGALNLFGHNMGVEFVADSSVSVKYKKECIAELKMFTKFTNAPKVFFENAESNKGHERQLQFFFDMFFGEGKVKATKEYVDHLKKKFIRATSEGYSDSSEFVLLQLIVEEARKCKKGEHYTFKSKLTCHKEHKEK